MYRIYWGNEINQGTDTYYSIFTATFFKIYHKKGYAIWGYMDMISNISPFFFVGGL